MLCTAKERMPAPRPAFRRLSESARHRLEVATAMAWEALVEEHIKQALAFIALFEDKIPLEEALNRYIREMDMGEAMGAAVRTRVLVTMDEDGSLDQDMRLALAADEDAEENAEVAEIGERWRRFRPDVMMRGVFERQKHREEVEQMMELAIARAEEDIIQIHVDNAITFAALLEDQGALSRGVEQYLASLHLSGGRGQSVLQRTMAKLAEVHLPRRA